jgi:CelD/BcsL family acetyltransferase involved in cellulose biosynthesis
MHQVEVATDEAGLTALWPAWEQLWRRVPGAWPFTAPAWLRPWWQMFGTGRPVVAIMRDPPGLMGVLPLYRLDDKLLPMGVGISDFFDVLLAPDAPAGAATQLLATALAATHAGRCDLPEMRPDAHLLRAKVPIGWRDETYSGSPCPVLPLLPKPPIPKGMRRDLRQALHRAHRAGGCRVETVEQATLPVMLDALVRLHTNRWTARGQAGVLADARVVAFHCAAAPLLLEGGMLRMQALHLRGRIVAVHHALVTTDLIGFYLGGFDREAAFESPGTILLGHMIAEAAGQGRREAHFLRGEEAYKYAWGALESRNMARSFIRT